MNIKIKIRKKVLLLPFRLLLHPKSQTGSVALVVALAMIVLLTMLAFVIDAGYLYSAKNKYQNGVEAAAMAGAVSLCDGDPEGVARQIAIDNGLPASSLVVKAGFYDENDIYGDFSGYKDFVAEEEAEYPEDEFNNAVMVKLNATEDTLMGGFVGKDEVSVGASAVAYLKRYGMVSLADDGEIRIHSGSMWKNGDIFANGDIKYVEGSTDPQSGTIYPLPEFTDSDMFAAGEILECPVTWSKVMFGYNATIHWDGGQGTGLPNAYPGSPEITEIRPIDDAYVEEFRAKADVVYNINSNCDNILFHSYTTSSGRSSYYFDLSGDHGDSRITYFFDAAGDDTTFVCLNDYTVNNSLLGDHPSNGNSITNITFAANCPITMFHRVSANNNVMPLGGEGDQQTIIISSKDIKLVGGFSFEGVVFLSGGNFLTYSSSYTGGFPGPQYPNEDYKKIRVIANGSIGRTSPGGWNLNGGGLGKNWNFTFGPPCPPTIPRLGRLELSASH